MRQFWKQLSFRLSFKSKILFLILSFIALLGIFTYVYATRLGNGISPDSVVYVDAARHILTEHRLFYFSYNIRNRVAPLTNFPPLYPFLLAIFSFSMIDPLIVARWFNLFLYIGNIVLVYLILYKTTKGSIWFATLGTLFALSSVTILEIHTMVWSEPLFIFISLIGFFLLSEYLDREYKRYLIGSSLVVCLTVMTRYIGIVNIATGLVGILYFSKNKISKKISDLLIFASITSLPIIIWLLRNKTLTGNSTNRKLVLHPIGFSQLSDAYHTIFNWFVPENIKISVSLFLPLIILLFIFITIVYSKSPDISANKHENSVISTTPSIMKILLLFIMLYFLFLIISISFIDAYTPINTRILSPIFISGLILILWFIHVRISRISNNAVFSSLGVLLFFVLLLYLHSGALWVNRTHNRGQGYSSIAWSRSELIERVSSLPGNITIFTNGPDVINILTGRESFFIPNFENPGTKTKTSNYLTTINNMKEDLEKNDGVIVYFNTIDRTYLPNEENLKELLPLQTIFNEQDGAILVIAK